MYISAVRISREQQPALYKVVFGSVGLGGGDGDDTTKNIQGGLDGGVPYSVFNKNLVLIRDSLSEISP